MKVLLDIKDAKADFVMELLKNLPFVKAKPVTDRKAEVLADLEEAVENLKLIKAGKGKARDLSELLNEL